MRIISPDGYRIFGGSVACHEAGHGVGLLHGNDSAFNVSPFNPLGTNDITRLGCMVSEDDFPSNTSAASRHLINGQY